MQQRTQPVTKPDFVPLPVPGLPVQVQYDGYKCMAFFDKQGTWVDLFTANSCRTFWEPFRLVELKEFPANASRQPRNCAAHDRA
jgi:hypothetical protein